MCTPCSAVRQARAVWCAGGSSLPNHSPVAEPGASAAETPAVTLLRGRWRERSPPHRSHRVCSPSRLVLTHPKWLSVLVPQSPHRAGPPCLQPHQPSAPAGGSRVPTPAVPHSGRPLYPVWPCPAYDGSPVPTPAVPRSGHVPCTQSGHVPRTTGPLCPPQPCSTQVGSPTRCPAPAEPVPRVPRPARQPLPPRSAPAARAPPRRGPAIFNSCFCLV